jgi:hypothetical protein
MKKLNDHIYIYRISGEDIVFDRSMPRYGFSVSEVDRRIKELRERGVEAFYTIGDTFEGAFY